MKTIKGTVTDECHKRFCDIRDTLKTNNDDTLSILVNSYYQGMNTPQSSEVL